MSTHGRLKTAIGKGLLWHLTPATGQSTSRTLLLHAELHDLIQSHGTLGPIGTMRGYLETFVTGGVITMGLTPRKHRAATMGRLKPTKEGTWDFRCRDPRPGTRVFGRFAHRDVFVAMYWAPRSVSIEGIDRAPLESSDLEWEMALGETAKRWSQILPDISPIMGSVSSDYITENSFAV